jgi:exonuclease III
MYPLKKWLVLCWNIHGLNVKSKQLALYNAIITSGSSVVCLQETKKTSFDYAFIKECFPRGFDEYVYIPSEGASGRLIII